MRIDLARMELPSDDSIKSIDVRKAPQGFFSQASTLEMARGACKRAKYLHFTAYDSDVGLAKACAQNNCTLVVSVSDLLPLPAVEKGKRIARIRRFAKMAEHFFAKVLVVSLARNEFEARGEFELKALSEYLGVKA